MTNKQGYKWLESKLTSVKPRTKMYYMLKLYLKQQGYWKNKPRGKYK